ncbi:MAG: DUF4190 domain-containing protein [Verrucomicrobiota bacterium]
MSEPSNSSPPLSWSKSAIWSLVLGLIGFATVWVVFGLLIAAVAAILGHLSLSKFRTGPVRGRRLAWTGLIISYLAILLFPFIMIGAAVSIPAVSQWRNQQSQARAEVSSEKASQLFVVCEAFARANRDRYPSDWSDLGGRFIPRLQLRQLLRSPHRGGETEAFELVPHSRPVLDVVASTTIVIQERAPSHIPDIAVVFADGNVSTLLNPDYQAP